MSEKEQRADKRRARFIETAGNLFLQRGYNGTSVRDILDAMGDSVNSPSVFYYYFESKDDIYQAVLQEQTEKYREAIRNCTKGDNKDPLKMMADILQVFLFTIRAGAFSNEAVRESLNNRIYYAYLHSEIVKTGTDVWTKIIDSLPWKTWSKKDSRRMAAFINGGTDALIRDYFGEGGSNLSDITKSVIDLFADVLHAPENERKKFKGMLRKTVKEMSDADHLSERKRKNERAGKKQR